MQGGLRGFTPLDSKGWTEWVATTALYDSYQAFADRHRERRIISPEELGSFMKSVGAKRKRGKEDAGHGVIMSVH